MHQDAHEFLNFLLNEIIDNLRQHWNSKKSLKTSINSIEENKASIEERKTNFQSDEKNSSDSSGRTFIQEIFEGSLISETQCLRCETITSRTEPFLDLSIEIENHTSLSYCLGQFSKNEMLCRDEKYYCSCCCSRQEAYRRMKIKSVPEVLIFHMKRFKYVESEYAFRKLCYRVVFPFELKLFHSVDESVDKNLGYELIAVIVHIGNLLKFGHYVCFVKVLGKWILYDDDRTEIVNEEAIRSCFGRVKSQHHQDGYILFYRKMQ